MKTHQLVLVTEADMMKSNYGITEVIHPKILPKNCSSKLQTRFYLKRKKWKIQHQFELRSEIFLRMELAEIIAILLTLHKKTMQVLLLMEIRSKSMSCQITPQKIFTKSD